LPKKEKKEKGNGGNNGFIFPGILGKQKELKNKQKM